MLRSGKGFQGRAEGLTRCTYFADRFFGFGCLGREQLSRAGRKVWHDDSVRTFARRGGRFGEMLRSGTGLRGRTEGLTR